MKFDKLKDAWNEMLTEKSFRTRSPHLFKIRKASPRDLIRLFSETRTCISLERAPPIKTHHGRVLAFARRWQRGKLVDVVKLHVIKTRTGYDNSISLFAWVDIGRIPDTHYDSRYYTEPHALASIGYGESRGGKWGQRWYSVPDKPLFIPEVEAKIPRLKQYPFMSLIVQCIWSLRDPRLPPLWSDVTSRSKSRRMAALASLADMDWAPELLPKVGERLADEGMRAFLDILSTDYRTNGCMLVQTRHLLKAITRHAPQLVQQFASHLGSGDLDLRIAAVRGLLSVARADRSSIPLLRDLLDDPCEPVRTEVLAGIGSIFHYGPVHWEADVSCLNEKRQQVNVALELGGRVLELLLRATDPEVIRKARYALSCMVEWSPKLKARVAQTYGLLYTPAPDKSPTAKNLRSPR